MAETEKKEKKELTMEDLQKQYKEKRKELQIKNYNKLIAALKVLNPGKKDNEIIDLYVAQAKAKKEEA